MCKISIIVPVYNDKQYLPNMISSILGQSFSDFELILVDDGSTDGSGEICDSYAKKEDRIRVLHKENGGVSSARNLGIDNAEGEWLYFVDADDELLFDALQVLTSGISDDVDVVMGGYVRYDKYGNVDVEVKKNECRILTQDEAFKIVYSPIEEYPFLGYVWKDLFRTEIVKRFNVYFDISIVVKEDSLFYFEFLKNSRKSVFFTTQPVYAYHRRSDSVTVQQRENFNTDFMSSFDALVKMLNIVRQCSKDDELIKMSENSLMYQIYSAKGRMRESHIPRRKWKFVLIPYKYRAAKVLGLGYVSKYEFSVFIRRLSSFFKNHFI